MSSVEYEAIRDVRKCFILGHVKGPRKRGYWWVAVQPPLPFVPYGDDVNTSEVILAERWEDTDISDLKNDFTAVYVCKILNRQAVQNGVIEERDIQLAAWAELARNPSLLPSEKSCSK